MQEFIEKIDKNGARYIEKCGTTNLYEKIQAALPATLIYNILKRYEGGDYQALNKVVGTYGDISTAPTSLMEAHQRLEDIKTQFGKLPVDLRAEFGHDVNRYIAELSSGSGMEIINNFVESKNKPIEQPKPEVKETVVNE